MRLGREDGDVEENPTVQNLLVLCAPGREIVSCRQYVRRKSREGCS